MSTQNCDLAIVARVGGIALLLTLVLGFAGGGIVGCGGTGGGSGGNHTPSISGLSLSQDLAYVGDGGGEVDIQVYMEFYDAGADLVSLTIEVLDDTGSVIDARDVDVFGFMGGVAGPLTTDVVISTDAIAACTVHVRVTDSGGLESNVLEAEFRIVENPWVVLTPPPADRATFSAVAHGGMVYLIGGYHAGDLYAPRVDVYDPAADSWFIGTPALVGVSKPAVASVSGRIYVMGGVIAGGTPPPSTDAVQEYDPITDTWAFRANMPGVRYRAAAAVQDGLVYVVAGQGVSFGGGYLAAVWRYDPIGDAWSIGADMILTRQVAAAASVGGQILVYGGYTSEYLSDYPQDLGYVRSLEGYDPLADTWSERPSGAPRAGPVGSGISGLFYAIGGNFGSTKLATVAVYDPAVDAWSQKLDAPMELSGATSATIGGRMYIFTTDVAYEYTPAKDVR